MLTRFNDIFLVTVYKHRGIVVNSAVKHLLARSKQQQRENEDGYRFHYFGIGFPRRAFLRQVIPATSLCFTKGNSSTRRTTSLVATTNELWSKVSQTSPNFFNRWLIVELPKQKFERNTLERVEFPQYRIRIQFESGRITT